MSKDMKHLLYIWSAVIIVGIAAWIFVGYSMASAVDTKSDGECTGHETVGRCADKCPDGSYSIGFKEDGVAICKLEPTGCPYGDSIPLGPECDKQTPQPAAQDLSTTPADSDTSTSSYGNEVFYGK